MTEPGVIVALDVGGTKMAAAVAGSDGQILDTATIPTKPADGADRAMQRILDAATGLARRAEGADQVTAVGADSGVPESRDWDRGRTDHRGPGAQRRPRRSGRDRVRHALFR